MRLRSAAKDASAWLGQLLAFWSALACGLFARRLWESDSGSDLSTSAVVLGSGFVTGLLALVVLFHGSCCRGARLGGSGREEEAGAGVA